jgi:hypothetical protein
MMISQQLLINGGKEGFDGGVVNWRGSEAKLEEKKEKKCWLEGWKKKELWSMESLAKGWG